MTAAGGEAAFTFVGAFVDELARSGLRHVCIAPGSRSTPLALTIARHPALRTWVHLDERAAAFFALGMARYLREPVAVLCTSGTAAANMLPAVVEAHAAAVPLLVLTADRPPELRDVGAAQTIEQNRLYGQHAKWFADVAVPEATPELLRYARTLGCRAAAIAAATPAGPVHLNFPFREPLVARPSAAPADMDAADALAWTGRPGGAPWVTVSDAPRGVEAATVDRIASLLRGAKRPLLVCGPQADPRLAEAMTAVAQLLGAPVLADPLSQLRWSPHGRAVVIDRYDAVLRHEATARALTPDVVLRAGALPTSKPLLQHLQRDAGTQLVVVDAAGWPDPSLLAAEMVHAEPRVVCEALQSALAAGSGDATKDRPGDTAAGAGAAGAAEAGWLDAWRRANERAGDALAAHSTEVRESFEGRALGEVAALVPSGGTLFVSSSMPVRDLDAFGAGDSREVRVLANRGANGIDGVVSSALGAAAASRESGGGPLVVVLGDLALHHDLSGLIAAKLHRLDVTIVVINNDGGGIFSFLPQADDPEHFEQLFGTPHGMDFRPLGALYNARYSRADTVAALRTDVAAGMSGHGLHIIEKRTDRARNVTLHHEAWAAVFAALDDGRD